MIELQNFPILRHDSLPGKPLGNRQAGLAHKLISQRRIVGKPPDG